MPKDIHFLCVMVISQLLFMKLSPLTNHKNTKKRTITGGFDRVNPFQQTEQGFDKLFGYNRLQTESFDYHNAMKNALMPEQLKLKELEF